jgi:hypothetical protein
MTNLGKKRFAMVMLLLSAAFIFTCSSESNKTDSYDLECEIANDNLDRNLDNLGLYNSIVIKFDNGNEPIIDNPYENEIAIMLDRENVIVQNLSSDTEYNLVVSGTTENGTLKIYGNHKIWLYLNGINITNPSGPAINIQNRQKVSVHLVSGTENSLADEASYEYPSGEDAKGTFFSKGAIYFFGCGTLTVTGKYAHAIVVDNDFEIESGKITIAEAVKDGIHANDYIYVRGGTINITSNGDGVQSENSLVHIFGGKITIKTTGVKSHGISSADSTVISDNANVKIETFGNGAKGIKSDGFIAIKGGTTDIKTSGSSHIDNSTNPPDTSSATGIKANSSMEISGGTLAVKVLGVGTKGVNVSENLTISGGDIKIEANDDGIKVHGNLLVNNGNLCVWSLKKQDIDCTGIETIKNGTVNNGKCVVGF